MSNVELRACVSRADTTLTLALALGVALTLSWGLWRWWGRRAGRRTYTVWWRDA